MNRNQTLNKYIDKAEELSKKYDRTFFIFEKNETLDGYDLEDDEDKDNDEIKYLISDGIVEFKVMPSRNTIYDTNSKLMKYERYKYILEYIKKIPNFNPSINNLGPDFEQSFFYHNKSFKLTIILTPNLFIKLVKFDLNGSKETMTFFFNEADIIDNLVKMTKDDKVMKRSLKLYLLNNLQK